MKLEKKKTINVFVSRYCRVTCLELILSKIPVNLVHVQGCIEAEWWYMLMLGFKMVTMTILG